MKTIQFRESNSESKFQPYIKTLDKVINLTEEKVNQFRAEQVYNSKNIYIYEVTPTTGSQIHKNNCKHYEIFNKIRISKTGIAYDGRQKYETRGLEEIYPFMHYFNKTAYCSNTLKNAKIIGKCIEIIMEQFRDIQEIKEIISSIKDEIIKTQGLKTIENKIEIIDKAEETIQNLNIKRPINKDINKQLKAS